VTVTPWSLAPQGERRFTWPYSLVCPALYTCAPTQDAEPSWTFHFTGATAQGQEVDVPISVTLPAQTLRTASRGDRHRLEERPGKARQSRGTTSAGGLGGPARGPPCPYTRW
jgi:hypothetical protein